MSSPHPTLYQCAECHAPRCMTCDELVEGRDDFKTAVRWCPGCIEAEARANGLSIERMRELRDYRRIGADVGRGVDIGTGRGYYVVTCGWCGGEVAPAMSSGFAETPRIGGRGFHRGCIDDLHVAARTLAASLGAAGGLCASFALGEYFERDTAIGGWRLKRRWAPGCGRPTEGFEPRKLSPAEQSKLDRDFERYGSTCPECGEWPNYEGSGDKCPTCGGTKS